MKELKALRPGTRVRWADNSEGEVRCEGGRRFIAWDDGQLTDGRDDWALKEVSIRLGRKEGEK